MGVDTKAIKQKIKAVGNVRKVTKTMEMVSVAKMRKAVERKKASYEYAKYALEILEKIYSMKDISHPLFEKRKTGKNLLVVIASDKGLCGPYNARVERQVVDFISRNPEPGIDVVSIGNRAQKIANKFNLKIVHSQKAFSDSVTNIDTSILTGDLRARFLQDKTYKNVTIIYTDFISSLSFETVEKCILPMDKDSIPALAENEDITKSPVNDFCEFEPSKETLLEELLPILMQIMIFQCVLESLASEHSSRMVAMRNASDNASRLKNNLTGQYNRARQAGITKEIIEIINAASAV